MRNIAIRQIMISGVAKMTKSDAVELPRRKADIAIKIPKQNTTI